MKNSHKVHSQKARTKNRPAQRLIQNQKPNLQKNEVYHPEVSPLLALMVSIGMLAIGALLIFKNLPTLTDETIFSNKKAVQTNTTKNLTQISPEKAPTAKAIGGQLSSPNDTNQSEKSAIKLALNAHAPSRQADAEAEPEKKTQAFIKIYPDPKFYPNLKPSKRNNRKNQSGIASFSLAQSLDPIDLLNTNPRNLSAFAVPAETDAPPPFFFIPVQNPEVESTPKKITFNDTDGDISSELIQKTLRLRKGETFVDVLRRANVRRQDRNKAASAIAGSIKLRNLQVGTLINITISSPRKTWFQENLEPAIAEENYLQALSLRNHKNDQVTLTREPTGNLYAETKPQKLTQRLVSITGAIRDNLYISMRKQGAPDSIIDDLANAFAFDVDFQRDIFQNDRFEAIYEVFYDENGDITHGGKLLFAKLAWRGGRHSKDYYLFDPKSSVSAEDYFTTNGQSARRLLMKTPIDGARLSSSFGPRRHPILGYKKTHKGVDFAARRGTPIKATGSGVIERANRYGSFGNYVRIRHANSYKTAYAHLKGFARGIKKGKRVKQGDIIGYVGTTGRSTGPHLHYEVHHKGKAINPQKLKIATGTKLQGKALEGFNERQKTVDHLRKCSVDPEC